MKSLPLLTVGLLLTTFSTSSIAQSPLEDCSAPQAPKVRTDSREVLRALTREDDQRQQILESYLSTDREATSAVDRVAGNRARIVLAAIYMSQSRFDEGRALLSKVELDSPVAVQASLLLSESWRLQGDSHRSDQWLLRTAQRYGSDPEALTSLLEQANELTIQGDVARAFSIYNLVQSQILDNAQQVSALREEADALINRLLKTRLDESRSIQSQMLKHLLSEDDQGLLKDLGELSRAAAKRRCIERQQRQVADHVFQSSAQITRIAPFLTMLEREQAMLEADMARLEGRESPMALQERNEIEQQLTALKRQRETLLKQQEQLPEDALQKQQQVTAQAKELDQSIQQLQQSVTTKLDGLNEQLLIRYRELAAESQYGRASLLHQHHARGG